MKKQYTGYKAGNNTKIYSGDIIRFFDITSDKYNSDHKKKSVAVIKWNDELKEYTPTDFYWNYKGDNIHYWNKIFDIEIIGNEIDNPELLDEVC